MSPDLRILGSSFSFLSNRKSLIMNILQRFRANLYRAVNSLHTTSQDSAKMAKDRLLDARNQPAAPTVIFEDVDTLTPEMAQKLCATSEAMKDIPNVEAVYASSPPAVTDDVPSILVRPSERLDTLASFLQENKEGIEQVIELLKLAHENNLYHARWYVCHAEDANWDLNMNARNPGRMPDTIEEMMERKMCGDLGFLMSVWPYFRQRGFQHTIIGMAVYYDKVADALYNTPATAIAKILNLDVKLVELIINGSPVLHRTPHQLYLKAWREVTVLDLIQVFENILEQGQYSVLIGAHVSFK